MAYDQILSSWKRGEYKPVYVFGGESDFVGNQALTWLSEHVLQPHERDFNQSVLYGKDTDAKSIESEAKRFPMMAERTLVIVREAQLIRDLDVLSRYVEQPQASTVLAIALTGKKLDKRRALYKAIQKHKAHAEYVESKAVADHQLPGWIAREAKNLGMSMTPKAAALLAESMGGDLTRLLRELEKYQGLLGDGAEVTPDIVERHTGISKVYNNFELIKALSVKDQEKVYKIAKSISQNSKQQPLVLTLGLLFSSFSKALAYSTLSDKSPHQASRALKVSEWALRDISQIARSYTRGKLLRIIGYLRDADGQAKGMGAPHLDESAILHELLFKILA